MLHESGVPDEHRKEYGDNTVWPTALVIDANGVIRFVELSKDIVDRPNPKTLPHAGILAFYINGIPGIEVSGNLAAPYREPLEPLVVIVRLQR